MSDFTASLPTTLFKASQGYVNTLDGKSLGQELITARQATYSDRIFTNTIPTNAPTDLSSNDAAWTVGGQRAFSIASPWIVKYTSIPLVAATTDEGNDKTYKAVAAPADITRGFVPPAAGANVLTNVILPRPYASTDLSSLYGITITKSGSPLDTTQYIFNRDAGTIKIYLPTVSASELTATFWRYEGRVLSNVANTDVSGVLTLGNKVYVGNSAPTFTDFSTALHVTNSNGAADLGLQDVSTGAALRFAASDNFGANMIQSGTSFTGGSTYPVSIGKMRSDVVTTIVDVSQQKVLIGDLKIPQTAISTDTTLLVAKDITYVDRTSTTPFKAQVAIRGTTSKNHLFLGSYGTQGAGGFCGTIQAASSANVDGTGAYGGNHLLLNPIGGFVGVGIAAPATTIDVSGATTLRGTTTITTGGIDVTGISTLRGATTITTGGIDVTGISTLRGATTITTGGIDVTGTSTLKGATTITTGGIDVSGATTLRGATTVAGTAFFGTGNIADPASTVTVNNKLTMQRFTGVDFNSLTLQHPTTASNTTGYSFDSYFYNGAGQYSEKAPLTINASYFRAPMAYNVVDLGSICLNPSYDESEPSKFDSTGDYYKLIGTAPTTNPGYRFKRSYNNVNRLAIWLPDSPTIFIMRSYTGAADSLDFHVFIQKDGISTNAGKIYKFIDKSINCRVHFSQSISISEFYGKAYKDTTRDSGIEIINISANEWICMEGPTGTY